MYYVICTMYYVLYSQPPQSSGARSVAPAVQQSSSSSRTENDSAALKSATAQAAESARAYTELRGEMEGLEKERDFYFEKLR
jgi:hypothetical protein